MQIQQAIYLIMVQSGSNTRPFQHKHTTNRRMAVLLLKYCCRQLAAAYAQHKLLHTSYVGAGGGAAASIKLEASLLALLATVLSHIAAHCCASKRTPGVSPI
jgi:hypothetical protein